jgi:NADH dehydrogenase FAD-containing subunit
MTGRRAISDATWFRAGRRRLLLVGGGHAHVAVLADLIRRGPPPDTSCTLLTPEPTLRYSGMVPGWLAGQHGADDGFVDLVGLAARAGVELVPGRCTALDPEARVVRTDEDRWLPFDIVSFDTGGEGRAEAVLGEDSRLIDVRPIAGFVDRLAALRARGRLPRRVVVAGGGAGGAELAFAMRNLAGAEPRPRVTLVTGAHGLLPGFAGAARRRVAAALERQGIALVAAQARIEHGAITAGGVSLEPADLILAALGSAAPGWLVGSGLARDARGFIAVGPDHRSLSHSHVFAAGDVAARADRPLAHSGVHAVFAGPVLAANLRAALAGRPPPRTYRARGNSLYLINTGDGGAIASYGPLAAEGRWVRALKHRIDKRWIAQYAALADGA